MFWWKKNNKNEMINKCEIFKNWGFARNKIILPQMEGKKMIIFRDIKGRSFHHNRKIPVTIIFCHFNNRKWMLNNGYDFLFNKVGLSQ